MRRINWMLVIIIVIALVAFVINFSQPYQIDLLSLHLKTPAVNNNPVFKVVNLNHEIDFKRGLDLQGGTSVTLRADMKDIPASERDDALNSAKAVIERRINFFGVAEPVIQTSKINNDYRIIVEIPGVTDLNQAVQLVGKTAKLTFWEGDPTASKSATALDPTKLSSQSAVPVSVQLFLGPTARKTDLTGSDLKQAAVTFDSRTGKPQVQLTFSTDGANKFGDITNRNVGKIVAIALDDQVVEAPTVNQAIYGGQAVITGGFTTDQAKTLQVQLNAGALPISLSVLQQQSVGATLGQESVEKSLLAGVLGFLVIVIFMTVLYGRLGIIASIALTIYAMLVLALFKIIPVTLTLAGIAGFILSVGIAVDANILIFERMKEELRKGRSRTAAIDLGFSRAWLSIRDSNMASLITSTVLFYFGTGVVRGFALTLGLGILLSMFSAIFVTRILLKVFYRAK
jgi:preprotein translocase subunit SecD